MSVDPTNSNNETYNLLQASVEETVAKLMQEEKATVEGSIDPNATNEYLTSFPPDKILLDRAYGVLIGAAIGDSLGAYCEFNRQPTTLTTLTEAMRMPPGGTWKGNHITGQVTDDTELAVSLAYGLLAMIGKKSTNPDRLNPPKKNNIVVEQQNKKRTMLADIMKKRKKKKIKEDQTSENP
eukprot:159663_1